MIPRLNSLVILVDVNFAMLRSIRMFAYSSQPSVQLRSLLKAKMPHKENNISVPSV